MVERSLSMGEVLGSTPRFSIFFFSMKASICFLLFFALLVLGDDHVDAFPGDPLNGMPAGNIESKPQKEEQKKKPLIELSKGLHGKVIDDLNGHEIEEVFGKLYGWMASEGAISSPSLKVQYINEMNQWGLVTGTDLKEGDMILSIPKHVMISSLLPTDKDPEDIPYCDLTRRWSDDGLKKLFIQSDERQSLISPSRIPNVVLSLCLIHESKKNGGSFYQPYLDSLPQFISQPITWDYENLEILQGSSIYHAAVSASEQLKSDYKILAETLFTVRFYNIIIISPFNILYSILVKDLQWNIIIGLC